MDITAKQRAALVKLGVYPHEGNIPNQLTKNEASKMIARAIENASASRDRDSLSLATLRAHDPHGGRGSASGRRYLCPLPPCRGYQNVHKHRSLSVADSGQYFCHRCHAKGVLSGNRTLPPLPASKNTQAARLRDEAWKFFMPALNSEQEAAFQRLLAGCEPIIGTAGARYVAARGISPELAHRTGVCYHPAWYGISPAVVFLGYDEHRNVVGAQGRYINVNVRPKVRGAGRTSAGTFSTPGAFDTASGIAVIVEAPIDALSIFAVTGIPSIALFGTGSPSWLRRRCAFKQVLIATDADAAGERGALHLAVTLTLCITVRRVQWPPGVKDANELLVRDREALRAAISALVKPGTVLHPPTTSSRLPSTE